MNLTVNAVDDRNNETVYNNSHSHYRWKEESAKDSKLCLDQNVHLLEDCFNGIDVTQGVHLENCVQSFVENLATLMSPFHEVPIFHDKDKYKKQIRIIEPKQCQP